MGVWPDRPAGGARRAASTARRDGAVREPGGDRDRDGGTAMTTRRRARTPGPTPRRATTCWSRRGLVRDYPAGDDGRPRAARRGPARRPRRAARGPRPVGERQDHAAQPARRPRPADGRHACSSTGRRSPASTTPRRPSVRRHDRRVRLPDLRPDPDPERRRERRGAAAAGRRGPQGARPPGRGAAGARRPRRPRTPPAARAVGRRAAAGRDRAGARQPAEAAARRRADGPARLRDRATDHAAHPDGRPGRRASRPSSRPTTR